MSSPRLKAFLVIYRFQHHQSVSGYNRIGDYFPSVKIRAPRIIALLFRLLAKLKPASFLLNKTGLTGYFPESQWLEWVVGLVAKYPRPSIIHFIYAENSYYSTAFRRKARDCRIIGTYHQPVAESRQFILKTDAIEKLDGIILMSESQREFFEPLVGRDKVFVVPHGIDITFFKPSRSPKSGHRIIAVGSWLRDFSTLAETMRLLRGKGSEIICDVVTAREHHGYFEGLENVQVHTGISDQQLLGLYHGASMAVLALSNTAANNALLESMACGLPIVITDLPAVREYTTPEGCVYVPPGDPKRLADEIALLIDDVHRLNQLGEANNRYAQKYSWEDVARQTMEVYSFVGGING